MHVISDRGAVHVSGSGVCLELDCRQGFEPGPVVHHNTVSTKLCSPIFFLVYAEAGSDSVQNDLDDQRSSVSQTHRKNGRSAITVGNHSSAGVGRFQGHSPVYVIRNLVGKPVRYSMK